jgi:uncharacterized repeat protein (TIGR01451 family)
LIVANRTQFAQQNVIVTELYDPRLLFVSSVPAPDTGTTDRWTIPFLPGEAARTITIVLEVRDFMRGGDILSNFAEVTNGFNVARAYQDTIVNGTPGLTMSIDDIPDPVRPGDQLTYTLNYGNGSDDDSTNVVVRAIPDPRLTFVSANPAPDSGTNLEWSIGTLRSTEANRIFATFSVGAQTGVPSGSLFDLQANISDDLGNIAAASETTLLVRDTQLGQFNLTLTGAPRNLRIGVVTTMIYIIKLQNIGNVDSTNVRVANALPAGLTFSQSVPPPVSASGGLLTYSFGTMPPGSTRLITIQAELSAAAQPGTTLTDYVSVSDDQGNSADASFSGGVRTASLPSDGRLSVSLTAPKRVVAGSKMKSSIIVSNGGRGDTQNVTLQLTAPQAAQLESAIPGPSSVQSSGGQTTATWLFPTFKGPGNKTIKLTHRIPASVPAGTAMSFSTNVSAMDGRSDTDNATVEIRN